MDRSYRHAITTRPWLPPSATVDARSGKGNVGQLVQGERHRRMGTGSVDGGAHRVQEGDHNGGVEGLGDTGGADVYSVGTTDEGLGVEVDNPGGTKDGVGAVDGQEAVGP